MLNSSKVWVCPKASFDDIEPPSKQPPGIPSDTACFVSCISRYTRCKNLHFDLYMRQTQDCMQSCRCLQHQMVSTTVVVRNIGDTDFHESFEEPCVFLCT